MRLLALLALLLATSCSQFTLPNRSAGQPTPSRSAPALNLPSAEAAASQYLEAWKAGDYSAMYELLTSISQSAMRLDEFSEHYQGVASEAVLSSVDYEILSALTEPEKSQVRYRVRLISSLVGEIQAETVMNLSLENGRWRVQWDDSLVLPQLKGGNYLSMSRQEYLPARANIYDRYGQALVAQTDATAIGLYPDQIDPAQAGELYARLSELTGLPVETIQARHANFPAGAGWYLPLGEAPAGEIAGQFESLAQFSGLVLEPYKARYYFENGVGSHLLGYMGEIPTEQWPDYERQGYRPTDRIGLTGIERWGELFLAGQRGGALYVRDAQGLPAYKLAEATARPGQSIYTTIDRDFEQGVQQALSGFRGAAVVLERDTGRILALVSSPDFNPNAFEPVNYNSETLLADLNNPNQPLLNRAVLGQYPLGSVFKIITMAAALESGKYTPNSSYYCGKTFEEIQGVTLYDWTNDYDFPASGQLTLPGGLIRSCNPWFYHIGLDLFRRELGNLVSDMARGFGLGTPTGVDALAEASGQVLDPESEIDATNQAIGQGPLLVTPLQVAQFMAAIGNGGKLFRPQLIEKIITLDNEPVFTFQPEQHGELPVSAGTLETIQQALVGVVKGTNPRGTAQHVFTGLDIPVAGKTGTAQTSISAPHAWFAGYTDAGNPDHPDIAIAVVAENAGEGSDYAAPIFRRIVELYYYGLPGKLYDWESTYNVIRTPAPTAIETPAAP